MNLQSPTTLLSSIQSMRSRLRSDKMILQDIKHDFSQITKKQRPSPIETILEQSLQDITPHPNVNFRRNEPSIYLDDNSLFGDENSKRKGDLSLSKGEQQGSVQKKYRIKIIELKREYQREISRLKQLHTLQIEKMKVDIVRDREQTIKGWQQKVEEQGKYIALLEEQVSSPIQSERDLISQGQYDKVINRLLQENTRLHQHLQQARDQAEGYRREVRRLMNQSESRSRFRFAAKRPVQRTGSQLQHHLADGMPKSAKSVYLINDQNIDRSNISQKWEDCQILNDQGGLRTIREFPLGPTQDRPSSVRNYLR